MEAMADPILSEIQHGPRRLRAICRGAERAEIARALMEHAHNRTHTADALGISRRTLINKIKAYRLTRAACRHYSERPSPLGPTDISTLN